MTALALLLDGKAVAQCRVSNIQPVADAKSIGSMTPAVLRSASDETYLMLRYPPDDTLSNGVATASGTNVVLKYSASRQLQWTAELRFQSNACMALDSNGRLLVAGTHGSINGDTLAGGFGAFVARFNDDGSVDTVMTVPMLLASSSTGDLQIATSNDHIYVVGRHPESAAMVIVVLDYNGQENRRQFVEVDSDGLEAADQIVVDNDGNIYVAASYSKYAVFDGDTLRGPVGFFDISYDHFFIASWASNGAYRWAVNRIQRTASSTRPHPQTLAVDNGGLYLLANGELSSFVRSGDTLDVGPLLIARLSLSTGEIIWVRSINYGRMAYNARMHLATTVDEGVYVALPGLFARDKVIRLTPADSLNVEATGLVVARYGGNGNLLCQKHIPNVGFQSALGSSRTERAVLAGAYREFTVFNAPDTLRSSVFPRVTLYIADLETAPAGVSRRDQETSGELLVQPNPASDEISILIPTGTGTGGRIELVNMLGKVVYNQHYSYVPENGIVVRTRNLSAGQYVVRVSSKGARWQQSMIVVR